MYQTDTPRTSLALHQTDTPRASLALYQVDTAMEQLSRNCDGIYFWGNA